MADRSEERHRSSEGKESNSKEGSSHSRLTSLLPTTGGGLLKPSSSGGSERQLQQGSLLGLDRLAAEKRQPRQYRRSLDETPSHPGGVNSEAQSRVRDRERRYRQQRYHPYYESGGHRDFRGGENERGREYRESDIGRGSERGRDYRGNERDHDYCESGKSRRVYHDREGERGSGRDLRHRDDNSRNEYGPRNSGNDSFRSRDRRPASSMPPPSQVTPSTQASRHSSFSSARSSQWRRRGERDYSIDAPTPRRDFSRRDAPDRTPARRRNNAASSWDVETPLPDSDDLDSKLKRTASDDSEFERQFYLAEDEGHYVQDQAGTEVDGDMGRFLFNNEKTRAREEEMEKKRQENPLSGRFSARKSALQDDQHAWEENRLLSSGAAVKGEVSLDIRTGEFLALECGLC